MNACQPFRDQALSLLEGELNPAAHAALLDHLHVCPACSRYWEQSQPCGALLRSGLPEKMPEAASHRLSQKIEQRLTNIPIWRNFLPRSFMPAWALTALLLLAGTGFWLHLRPQSITLQGWLVDAHCAPKLIAQGVSGAMHPRVCDLKPKCRLAGYGVLAHGHFVRFDAHGNKVAWRALLRTHAPDHLRVLVSGKKANHVLRVAHLQLEPAADGGNSGDNSGESAAARAR